MPSGHLLTCTPNTAKYPRTAAASLSLFNLPLTEFAGLAGYDHLDLSFTPSDPTASAAADIPAGLPSAWFDSQTLRRQFGFMAAYVATLDLTTLHPDISLVHETPRGAGAVAARATIVGAPGLLAYLGDLRPYGYAFGSTRLSGTLRIGGAAPGTPYASRRLDPQSGEWSDLATVTADDGGTLTLEIPQFREDLLVELAAAG